jgi:GTP-binding protein YchF
MALSVGIVGLPNVGKSTLFNTITNSQVDAANYPFATIEPNVGVVKVPDQRLLALAELINPKKVTNTILTFVDIAGLVKGASNGEGLGNKFLGNIREVDAILHVVRCFYDKQITHYYQQVDPIRDFEIINMELISSDLELMEKKHLKVVSKSRSGDKEAIVELGIVERLITMLKSGSIHYQTLFNVDELAIIKTYNLLTCKPMLYICNIDAQHIADPIQSEFYMQFCAYLKASGNNTKTLPIAISMENEISTLSENERKEFMDDLKIDHTGLETIIRSAYDLLDIQTFYTFGVDETKA